MMRVGTATESSQNIYKHLPAIVYESDIISLIYQQNYLLTYAVNLSCIKISVILSSKF